MKKQQYATEKFVTSLCWTTLMMQNLGLKTDCIEKVMEGMADDEDIHEATLEIKAAEDFCRQNV